ncbi:hypothetical protein ACLMJK_000212 [Lecanora helva]
MPFFKELRRRKTGSKAEKTPPDDTKTSDDSNGTSDDTVPTTKSSSTLNSLYGSSTPPSSIQPHQSTPNLVMSKSASTMTPNPLPQRPMPLSSGLNTTPSVTGTTTPKIPISTFAPRIVTLPDNSWIGEPSEKALDGTLTVNHHQDNFPPTIWPVSDSHFKALLHLTPGPNRLRFDFASPKVASSNSSVPAHSSWLSVSFLPLINSPPLQLAILLGKDSPGTFDAVPERRQKEGNDLNTAIRKFRMSAYLWQAFTGEQMARNGFGRRCFRFEEEWQTGSLTFRDREIGQMRNEAKVHVIRSDKTVAELRDFDVAQQYDKASRKGDLYNYALEAVKDYFKPMAGQKHYISLLLLDSHWDPKAKIITGHAGMGGGSGDIQLAIFGSQALQSYPTSIEEVVPALTDCTRTDTNFVANDCNESGSNWEAANVGIGGHLHETGHAFDCTHQIHGIMQHDYVRFNRTFLCREPYSTRTKSPGMRLVLQPDECVWHRLDTLRFRYHPCFRLPTDAPLHPDESIQVWPADNGNVLVTAPTGIPFVEIFANGEETCRAWLEYNVGNAQGPSLPRQIVLTESDLKAQLPDDRKAKKLGIRIHSAGQGSKEIEDFTQLVKSKEHTVKLPTGKCGYKSCKLGFSTQEGSQPQHLILENSHIQTKLLTSIKVYHGFAVDGLEFLYEDSTSQMFGHRGGQVGASEYFLGMT